ncbi:YadA-like family protein [Paraburkholderia hospita]|uniref:YadA-like family protein n=1 Tax=Paraburkholderia hospita TaxID=169430 RepID=UPI000B344D88|nr:YadA-like family protein [Paraburkholderia hospita]OUL91653.1 hypothetical protein CA601_12685 [Paraburkholderia hospita]
MPELSFLRRKIVNILGLQINKTYRSVWNETTGTWVAAAETTTARGKRSRTVHAAAAFGALIAVTGTALTMIPDVDQGKTIAVGIGAGSYHGYQATALGASARITQNIKVKLGAGIGGQGTTVGVGASY